MANYTTPSSTTARDAIDRASDTTSQLGHDAAAAAKSLGKQASHAVESAAEMAQDKLDTMTSYVRRNPLQATAIAAGIGFMFAMIARR